MRARLLLAIKTVAMVSKEQDRNTNLSRTIRRNIWLVRADPISDQESTPGSFTKSESVTGNERKGRETSYSVDIICINKYKHKEKRGKAIWRVDVRLHKSHEDIKQTKTRKK